MGVPVKVSDINARSYVQYGKTKYEFEYANQNYTVNDDLNQKEVYDSINHKTITHIVLDIFNRTKNKSGKTYHGKIIDMIAYPTDYRKLFKSPGFSLQNINCSNYGLALDKFGRNVGNKLDYISSEGQDNLQFKYNLKSAAETAQAAMEKVFCFYKSQGTLTQLAVIQNWRMVLNLGANTAYNNGFLLHKLYGVPYLPGQAIKGVLRHYVITTYFDSKEETAWKNPSFRMLLGNEEVENNENKDKPTKANQGKAIFLDAFPTNDDFKIEADIMNPHNTKYYDQSNLTEYPNDTTNPTPIKFLTLKEAKFNLSVFVPKEYEMDNIFFTESGKWGNPKEAIEQLMIDAMEIQGIGAKTNLGYGRLVIDEKKRKKEEEEQKIIKEEIEAKQKEDAEKKARIENFKLKQKKTKEQGLSSSIETVESYGSLQTQVRTYKLLLNIPEDARLPEHDHQPFLEKLNQLLKKTKPKFKSKYNTDSKKKYITTQVGTEKMEQWINEHFPNK